MKHRIQFAAALLGVALLAGCASSGRKIDQSAVARIQKGVSTKAEVRSSIGTPESVSRNSDGEETWTYHYMRSSVKGESFIPIVGTFMGGMNTQTQTTLVRFGPDGIVSYLDTTYGSTSVDENLLAGGSAKMDDVEGSKRPK